MSSFDDIFSEGQCEAQPDSVSGAEGGSCVYVDPRYPQVTKLVGIDADGHPFVGGYARTPFSGTVARATVSVTSQMIGSSVVVVFEGGDLSRPIILGVLLDRVPATDLGSQISDDGRRVTVEAKEEIALRCGEASLTLTAAGRVSIRGTYVVSRSSGYNKIKGAVVDIN